MATRALPVKSTPTLPSLPWQRWKKLFYRGHLFACLFLLLSFICVFQGCPLPLPPPSPEERGSASGTSESPACPFEGEKKKKRNGRLLKCEGGKRWSESSQLWGRIGRTEKKTRSEWKEGMRRRKKDRERKATSSIPKRAEGNGNYSTVRGEKSTRADLVVDQSRPALIRLHSLTVTDNKWEE